MPGDVDCIDCNSLFTVDIMTITGPIDINWRYFDIFFLIQIAVERSSDLSSLLRRVVESGTVMRMVMFVLVALATIALAAPKKDGKKTGGSKTKRAASTLKRVPTRGESRARTAQSARSESSRRRQRRGHAKGRGAGRRAASAGDAALPRSMGHGTAAE